MADPVVEGGSSTYPGPSFHVDLAALDALHMVHYSRRLLIFRCDSHTQLTVQLSLLKDAIKALVQKCPILGGTVAPLPPKEAQGVSPDWRTIVPGKGLELIYRDLRNQMPSFEQLETSGFAMDALSYDLLVPIPQDIGNDQPYAACKLQFSAISGGSILTWAMSHSLADGSGNNELIRMLADEIRLAQDGPKDNTSTITSPVGIDRTVIRNMKSDIPFRIADHPGYMLNAPSEPPSHPFQATFQELPILFHIPTTRLAQLKADAQQPDSPPISTHDAMAALVWRSMMFIRSSRSASAKSVPPETMTNLFMPSDGRRHLGIPDSYIGNVVYQLSASLSLGDLLSPNGLQLAASALRTTIRAVTPDKVRSIMAQTNKQWVDWAFMGSYSSTGVPMGSDWTSFSLYEQDWGKAFGKVVRFRYPFEEGTNAIYPKLSDGSAEIAVAVMKDEVEILTGEDCFGKYVA